MTEIDRHQLLFDQVSDAVILCRRGEVVDCNRAALQLLGCPGKEEALGRRLAELDPRRQPCGLASADLFDEMVARAREEGVTSFDWVIENLGGREVPLRVTLNAIELDGEPGLMVIWQPRGEGVGEGAELLRTKAELMEANSRLRQAKERTDKDLQAAVEMQRRLLPHATPLIPGLSFAWRFQPATQLAGDLLNIFRFGDGKVGFFVIDVTGHGAAAALVSVTASMLLSPAAPVSFTALAQEDGAAPDPGEVISRLNSWFTWHEATQRFGTVFYGVLDPVRLELAYVSAGHPPSIVLPREGEPRRLDATAPPLGVIENLAFEAARVTLERGDRLFVLSDGIPEAMDAERRMFGLDRAIQTFREGATLSIDATVGRLMAAVDAWCAPRRPNDDISVIATELTP